MNGVFLISIIFQNQILKNKPLTIVGDGKQSRDFVYVTDVAKAFFAAAKTSRAGKIYNVASQLNISSIIEVHTIEEAMTALHFKNAIIGINNRDLKTLKTDMKTTYDLHKILINHSGPLICESGIKTENDVKEIVRRTNINNFLIGESLLKDLDKKTSLLKKITQIGL